MLDQPNYCEKCKEVYDDIHCKCFPKSFTNMDEVLNNIMLGRSISKIWVDESGEVKTWALPEEDY